MYRERCIDACARIRDIDKEGGIFFRTIMPAVWHRSTQFLRKKMVMLPPEEMFMQKGRLYND